MLLYQTRNGVFGRPANGGGIFNNAISGLGALGATMQTGLVPSSVSALTEQCVSASCKGIFEPNALAACIQACAAKAEAQASAAAPTKSSGGGGVVTVPVTPTAAQAAMYQPSTSLSQKTIALAVGGVAAAAFVYLYMTKKKKG